MAAGSLNPNKPADAWTEILNSSHSLTVFLWSHICVPFVHILQPRIPVASCVILNSEFILNSEKSDVCQFVVIVSSNDILQIDVEIRISVKEVWCYSSICFRWLLKPLFRMFSPRICGAEVAECKAQLCCDIIMILAVNTKTVLYYIFRFLDTFQLCDICKYLILICMLLCFILSYKLYHEIRKLSHYFQGISYFLTVTCGVIWVRLWCSDLC